MRALVVYSGKRPQGGTTVTARRGRRATTSSPRRPLGDVAGLRDQRPDAAPLVVPHRSGEGDQGAHRLSRPTVQFTKVSHALHADEHGGAPDWGHAA